VLRQIGNIQNTAVLLAADTIEVVGMFQAPRWGIFTASGAPAFIGAQDSGLLAQVISFLGPTAQSVGAVGFRSEYRISTAPQEQGAFQSYNKVQMPFDGRVTYRVGGTQAQRSSFLQQVIAAEASLDLFSLVTPEITYPSVNITHHDYRRTASAGLTLIEVDIWVEEVRVSGTTQYTNSNTGSPSGSDAVNGGAVQPLSPNDVGGTSSGSPVSPFVPVGALT
jgi:hypothetical protein